MNEFQIVLDSMMCLGWVITYIFVIIGTYKYQYPLISPVAQAIIAPFEIAVLIKYIVIGYFGWNYPTFAYLLWTILDVGAIILILNMKYLKPKLVKKYVLLIILITVVMCYCVIIIDQMYFFSYFNTMLGEIIWFKFIFKDNYPLKRYSLFAFISKFIADTIAIFVYLDAGPLLIDIICIALPILDLLFIIVWFYKKQKCKIRKSKKVFYYVD